MATIFGHNNKRSLYDEMRDAINCNNHQQMKEIIRRKEYKINKVGGDDMRTALHTATMHNAHIVQYLYLATEQAGTCLKSGPV